LVVPGLVRLATVSSYVRSLVDAVYFQAFCWVPLAPCAKFYTTRETGSHGPIIRATWPPDWRSYRPKRAGEAMPTRSAAACSRSRQDGLGAAPINISQLSSDLLAS
jgi:hypothetical protein